MLNCCEIIKEKGHFAKLISRSLFSVFVDLLAKTKTLGIPVVLWYNCVLCRRDQNGTTESQPDSERA